LDKQLGNLTIRRDVLLFMRQELEGEIGRGREELQLL
jgi:hypothetical protein